MGPDRLDLEFGLVPDPVKTWGHLTQRKQEEYIVCRYVRVFLVLLKSCQNYVTQVRGLWVTFTCFGGLSGYRDLILEAKSQAKLNKYLK